MRQIIIGQVLLIICCIFYLIWWYLGFRPNTTVNRMGGINGILLLLTAIFGISGISFSLLPTPETVNTQYRQLLIVVAGIGAYILLMFITKTMFNRIVTSELFLIVGWTMLELSLLNRLGGSGLLSGSGLVAVYIVIAIAFVISMILYVAYYRMEEMKAFYAAMVPLVTEGISMGVLVWMLLKI